MTIMSTSSLFNQDSEIINPLKNKKRFARHDDFLHFSKDGTDLVPFYIPRREVNSLQTVDV